MSTTLLKDQEIWFDGYRLTTRANSVALSYEAEAQDDTTFGDDTRSSKGGLKMVSCEVAGLYDADPYDNALFSNVGVANKVITIGSSATEGDPAYFFKMLTGSYSPFKNSVGEIAGFSAGGTTSKGNLIRGKVIANKAGISTSGDRDGFVIGAASATQTIYAALHVLNVDDPADTLDVVIESDTSDTFSSPITQITFDQASAIGSQFKSVAGPNTDTYYRVVDTVTGTTPSFDYVVVIGIL